MFSMKVLVTGATGFVGSNIVEALLKQGYQVKALVRKTSNIKRLEQKKVELVYGDLLNPESLIIATENVDVVIHAAGILGGFNVTLHELRQIHVKGTQNLLKAAKRNRIKRFILISSIAAVGSVKSVADETTGPRPTTPYDKAKYEGEEIVRRFCNREKIEYTIIRSGFVYGMYEMGKKAKLFQLIQNQKFFIIGNGKNLVSFVYAENLTQGILLSLNNSKAINNTYIISDKRPYEMNEFINTIAYQLNVKKPLHIPKLIAYMIAVVLEMIALVNKKEPLLSRERISNLTSSFGFSIKKAQQELGYNPKIDLEEGIAKTIVWYRKNNVIK